MGVQTLLGSARSDGFRFNFAPLLPIALSVFCLSGLGFYHVALSGTGASDSLFQGLVIGLYRTLGFVPSFMLFLMVLSWSSIWFISGSLADPAGRLGRLLLLTVSLAVLVNLQPEVGPAAPHSGVIGHFLAVRLQSIFGYTIATLLVAPLALVTLLLATDFFFYRYFETLGEKAATGPKPSPTESGVEAEATETLKSLRFASRPRETGRRAAVAAAISEPVDLVVAEEAEVALTSTSSGERLVLDVDEDIFWEPPETSETATAVLDPDPATEEPAADSDLEAAGVAVEEEVGSDAEEADVEEEYEDEGEEEYEEGEEEEYEEDGEEADEEYEEEDDGEYEDGEDEEYEDEDEVDEEEDEDYELEYDSEDEEDEEEVVDEDDDDEEFELAVEESPEEVPEESPEVEAAPVGEPLVIRLDRDPADQPEIVDLDEPVILCLDGEEEELLAEEKEEKTVEIPRPTSRPGLAQEARELVVNTGRVSASFLQRRLRVDFQEAMGLLRVLKGQGVIQITEGDAHGKLVGGS